MHSKVECPECHRKIDVRGYKLHLGTHANGHAEGVKKPMASAKLDEILERVATKAVRESLGMTG